MTQGKFTTEEEIRKFLLGQMTEESRTAFEERFIAGEAELFDEIRVVEDELIEAYLRGRLPDEDLKAFEQAFLESAPRRKRVELTRAMFDRLDRARTHVVSDEGKATLWSSFVALFGKPQFAFGTAMALLLVVFGIWFFGIRGSNDNEIVRTTEPTPVPTTTPITPQTPSPTPVIVNNQPDEPNANKPRPVASPTVKEPPKPLVATLALFTGGVRAGGKVSELDLSSSPKGVSIQLNLDSRDYQTYRAEVVDADGNVVARSGKLTARGSRVTSYFPTDKLKRGDYLVKLYGFSSTGQEESAADFQFRVRR